MDIDFEIKGDAATAFEPEEQRDLILKMVEKMAESVRNVILREFESSIKLMAYAGEYGDEEAIRAITRSVKVEVIPSNPPDLTVEFKDDLSHWYEGGELPDELVEILQNIINESIEKWSKSPEAVGLIVEYLGL
jgi:hypothetical protein